MNIKIKKHIYDFSRISYVDEGEEYLCEQKEIIDCSLGVNPFGCSRTISDNKELFNIESLNNYPQYPYTKIREELSEYWSDIAKISSENIRLGCGSMGILSTINMLFVDKEYSILGYCPQFSEYITDVKSQGGRYEYIELKDNINFKFDADKLINKMNDRHQAIYIDNPNNPTGQVIPLTELIKVIEAAEKMNIAVVIDEAYGEFMDRNNSVISLINKYSNLFVIRTFSKGFGLAGIRVGYVVCNKSLLEYFKKVELPFSINTISYNIASAALRDSEFIKDSIYKIKDAKSRLIGECSKIKILETSLETPIMLMMHPNKEVDLYKAFMKNNVVTESGQCFIGLRKNFVRLRVPRNIDALIEVVKKIEDDIVS
ncbi:pyridoxal phosphate-dependent aminotransferase [Clostridium thailandense]|uniref:pyridoxal phosphate-dependent aminotransferase n=1 Tax=Clostridium thailandense TaxID=2794346 RepID=UPI00398970F3